MAGCGEFHFFSPLKKFWKSIQKILVKKSNLAKCFIWPKGELLPNAPALLSPPVTYTFTFSFLIQLHE